MAERDSVRYTVAFAAVVCVVCALMVAVAAVALAPTQKAKARLYMQKNVLLAAGLIAPGQDLPDAAQRALFQQRIEARLVDFAAGTLLPAGQRDALDYDQRAARNDPAQSRAAPPNRAGIARVPNHGLAYFVRPAGGSGPAEQVVLAVEGLGMWGTVYGFIALAPDGNTVTGLAFYDQKETPGLGGEIGNPRWQALWRGRKGYDAQWQPQLQVIKGPAGPAEADPHRVDGLSGATVTSNAVTRLVQFWLSDAGYGRWLRRFREGGVT
ncbi:MAG TPA: Na(+)-translocating NADH-quinone reductase subunit C [Burkholderiaceae bacterium]|nr:Na(+)-translocating NADH-quinone reductase subunit C [Burkholderiaceae bacterium]